MGTDLRAANPRRSIVSMRRVVLVVVVALVVGGEAWALWPATTWPRAFCAPVVRVVGADARAIVTSRAANENLAITPAEHKMVAALQADIPCNEAPVVECKCRPTEIPTTPD